MALTATRQEMFAVYPAGTAGIGRDGRRKARRRETWQMNCNISASLKRDVKLAAFEAGVSQSDYLEAALVRQLIRDGWLTEDDARRRCLVMRTGEDA